METSSHAVLGQLLFIRGVRMEMLKLRPLDRTDSHYLLDIDNKVSEYPWGPDEWELMDKFFPEWETSIATVNSTPKGFSVTELDKERGVQLIHKLVVRESHPTLRTLLLERLEYRAFVHSISTIEFVLSETECRGKDDPYDRSAWLKRQGFRCENIRKDTFESYGKVFDGFVFRKLIHEGKYV